MKVIDRYRVSGIAALNGFKLTGDSYGNYMFMGNKYSVSRIYWVSNICINKKLTGETKMSNISIEERVEGLLAARQRARNLIALIHATAESFEDKQQARRFFITIAQELHIPRKERHHERYTY